MEKIFLTRKETFQAIYYDFIQYEPQFELFQTLWPVVFNNQAFITKDSKNSCTIVTRGRKSKIRKINDGELGNFLYKSLTKKITSLKKLAEIGHLVFQIKAYPGSNPEIGEEGIWFETDMDIFKCSQCGDCCRNLLYHNDCTEKDYMLWKETSRVDIMERVLVLNEKNETKKGMTQYRIWVNPETGYLSKKCPWLEMTAIRDRYVCSIEDVKPEICRQYPFTKKHANMTDCRGRFI